MKKLFATLCLLFVGLCASFAQEGTYVVTTKAPEIQVYNHDNQVIGHLQPGDKVQVSTFHQTLPQADPNAVVRPITFVEYKGEEGILYLESPDWMRCESDVTWSPEDDAAANLLGVADRKSLFWACALYVLLLLIVAKPFSLLGWTLRKLPTSHVVGIGLSLLAFAAIGLETYYLLTAENPFWFCQWSDVGILELAVGFIAGIVMLIIKYAAINFTVWQLANTSRPNPNYFNYLLPAGVVFIGTWLVLIVSDWSVDYKNYLLIPMIAALAGYVVYSTRHVFQARGILSGVLVVLVILAGISTLCYASLEIFRRLLQVAITIWFIHFYFSSIGGKQLDTGSGDNGPVNYLDPETGEMRQLYKEGNGYRDYSDGSVWTPTSSGKSYNRIQ